MDAQGSLVGAVLRRAASGQRGLPPGSPRSAPRRPGRAGPSLVTGGSSTRPVKIVGRWTYLYRAIDQPGQVIDIWLSHHRDLTAARAFLQPGTHPWDGAGRGHHRPGTGLPAGPRRVRPCCSSSHAAACEQRRGGRPWPTKRTASTDARTQAIPVGRILAAGHASVQKLRPGHYEIVGDQSAGDRLRAAFDELMHVYLTGPGHGRTTAQRCLAIKQRNSAREAAGVLGASTIDPRVLCIPDPQRRAPAAT
jgi:transposase, IS6 family